ncbi:unnamed protein product [Candidula unifasciata]|uniref:Cytochrome b5 heme-binding domain-containing protein n=1 Tax=Candidula unifasciata TaxID=100452 RepID=A0A8S3YJV7_9EUPU|nr:unnamed protein product [Candidula unifasciata]
MKGKVVLLLSTAVFIAAYFISPNSVSSILNSVFALFEHSQNRSTPPTSVTVFSKEELAKFKGDNGETIYLALVGHVYDVSKGRKHYGPGGGYEFFAGIDGSKAYVTGQFDKDGLVDDISELTPAEVLSLDNWKSFYEKDYTFVGKVEGAFYDKNGAELPMLDVYRKKLKIAMLEKEMVENDNRLFPPCNSEWSQASGGRIWCTKLSGGIARDWVGVPRMYYVAGSSKPRCACVRTTGPPSHDPESTQHKNRGDLDNPNLSIYPNCDEMSESCPMPQ